MSRVPGGVLVTGTARLPGIAAPAARAHAHCPAPGLPGRTPEHPFESTSAELGAP